MSRDITEAVRAQYAATAKSNLTNHSAGVQAVAEAFGYSAEELLSIPAEANMGLSCGNFAAACPVTVRIYHPPKPTWVCRAATPWPRPT